MKKLLVLSILCLFSQIWISAQNGASVSGRIINSLSNDGLPYSTVTLTMETGDGLVSGAVSDEEGRFVLRGIQKGNYVLYFSFIGYESAQKTILIGELNDAFDLGRIILKPTTETLNELTVKAQKSVLSSGMEKKSFQMSDQITQQNGSVLDVMKGLPSVTVDQDGKVILRGSDKVIVLINGKQSSLTGFGNQKGLDNIPSSNIEAIEVINNPSAKYDAAGMAGIINIIYKKEKSEGFNGDLSFNYGLGALTKPKADLPSQLGSYSMNPKYIPGLNLNYRTEKMNAFVQSEVMHLNKLPNNEFTTRTYDDGRITASQVPENRTQTHIILKGGLDYFIDPQNTISISGMYDWEHHIDTAQVPYIDMLRNQRYRYIAWNEEEITGYMNYVANYNHKFAQAGHAINVNAQYTKGWEDETYYINDSSAIRPGRDVTSILATEHTSNVSVDYVKPLSSGRLEAGTKLQIRRLPVDYTVQRGERSIIYPELGEWSDWGENIYAAYANFVYERSNVDVEAGLRAEQTNVFYDIDPANKYYNENDSYNYFELFPNVRLTLKPSDSHRFSLFYNRRIDRPGEPELRIFPKSDDHELLKIGNPYLRPQFTQSYELAYRFKWQSGALFLSAYFRDIDNPYTRIYTIDSENPQYNVITKSYANTGHATNAGLELIANQQVFDFWKLSGSWNYYRNSIDAYEGSLLFPQMQTFSISESSENTWDLKVSNQFKLPKSVQIQLTGVYYAPNNIAQGKRLARSSVDFGLVKKIYDGRGEISLTASDIFNGFGIREEIVGDGFTAIYVNNYETQVISLGLKFKF